MEEKQYLTNSRGLKLALLVNRPDSQRKCGSVLVLHGFTGFKEEEHIAEIALALVDDGFVAVRFDASGFGESEGDPDTDYRVSNYLSDVGSVHKFLRESSWVDRSRIGICGHSLGGTLSLIFAAQHPEIRACCAIQPPTKLTRRGGTLDVDAWRISGWLEKDCEGPFSRPIKLPWAMGEDAEKVDASEWVSKIKVPTMIMIGTADINVPPANTKSLYDGLACRKELIELDGFDHNFKRSRERRQKVTSLTRDFFNRNLGQ